jgi:hypothetical protein
VEVQQKRMKEKKQLMDNVKKFRKGKMDSLDFLDDDSKTAKEERGRTKGLPGNGWPRTKNSASVAKSAAPRRI